MDRERGKKERKGIIFDYSDLQQQAGKGTSTDAKLPVLFYGHCNLNCLYSTLNL